MNFFNKIALASTAGILCVASATKAQAQTVFFTDFESGVPTEIGGAGSLSETAGYDAFGFGDSFFRNPSSGEGAATTLTLTDLPEHDSIDLNFLVAVLDTWDGNANNFAAPDIINVRIDGVSIFSEAFSNVSATAQSYAPPAGVELTPRPFTNLGFGGFGDSAYNLGLDPIFNNIAHVGDTLTIEWFASGAGLQGEADESFAIDNIEVVLNGTEVENVPEPSVVLGSFVVLGMGSLMRRAKKQ